MTTERRFMWVRDHNKYLEVIAPEDEDRMFPRYWCVNESGEAISLAVIKPDWALVSYNEAIAGRLKGARVVFRTTE